MLIAQTEEDLIAQVERGAEDDVPIRAEEGTVEVPGDDVIGEDLRGKVESEGSFLGCW